MATKKRFYLYKWNPMYKSSANLPRSVVMRFDTEQRALGCKKYMRVTA